MFIRNVTNFLNFDENVHRIIFYTIIYPAEIEAKTAMIYETIKYVLHAEGVLVLGVGLN